jgi:hypothetical protein
MIDKHLRVVQPGDFLLACSAGRVSCPTCSASSVTSTTLVHVEGCELARKLAAWRTFNDSLDASRAERRRVEAVR